MNPHPSSNGASPAKWFFTLDDRRIAAPRQHISETLVREQGAVPPDCVILRDHDSSEDEVLGAGAPLDLVQGNVFYTERRGEVPEIRRCAAPAKRSFSLDDRTEEAGTPEQTRESLLELFGVDRNVKLFRDHESTSDEVIEPGQKFDFAQGPVFYTRAGNVHKVEITIDGKSHPVVPGDYSVTKLKEIGGVAAALELEQVINGKLTPLPPDKTVCIRGGEVFVSHPCSGGSS